MIGGPFPEVKELLAGKLSRNGLLGGVTYVVGGRLGRTSSQIHMMLIPIRR